MEWSATPTAGGPRGLAKGGVPATIAGTEPSGAVRFGKSTPGDKSHPDAPGRHEGGAGRGGERPATQPHARYNRTSSAGPANPTPKGAEGKRGAGRDGERYNAVKSFSSRRFTAATAHAVMAAHWQSHSSHQHNNNHNKAAKIFSSRRYTAANVHAVLAAH